VPLLFLALYVAVYARFAVRLVLFPLGLDQGEASDAWSAWLIAQGQLPYSHNDHFPYFSINYPPVWAALVALPMAFTGPSLAPARAFSAFVTMMDALFIGMAVWRLTRAGGQRSVVLLAAFIAGALFLSSPYVFHTTPLSRLNSTLTLFGLLALSFAERPTPRRMVVCVLCLIASVFTKPTGLFIATACLGWVVMMKPRIGLGAAGAFAAAAAVLLVALQTGTGGAFWTNVVSANAGVFDAGELGRYLVNFLGIHAVVVGLAVVEVWRSLRGAHPSPWMFALGAGLAESLLVGHWGAGESYFLDALAVSCVLAGCAIARILGSRQRGGDLRRGLPRPLLVLGAPATVLGVLLFAQMLLMSHGAVSRSLPFLPDRGIQAWILGRVPMAADLDAGEEIVQLIRESKGPVLSEEPSFALAAGREIVGNANHLRDLDEKGLWRGDALVADIRARRFGVVVLNAQRYPKGVLEAIGQSYYVTREVEMGAATYLVFLPGKDPPGRA
jgi:hypothetical protein